MLFQPSRDQARRFFVDTWHKHQHLQALTDLERMTLGILLQHPEYQRFLNEAQLDHDWRPEHGDTNPFLHLGMHLAIEEQLSIDQPQGVRALFQQLCAALGDPHAAQHAMMDGLAEMIWQAQRHHTAPDPAIYFDVLRRKLPPGR